MRTILIVPAYNEADSIVAVVESIVAAGYDYIVVNDGSTDDTLAVCREHGISCLNLRRNLGIGGAVQAGHKFARQHGYDIDIQFDGDGQHDIEYVGALIEAVEAGSDLVIGSRFLERTSGFQSSALRRIGINWLSFWIHLFTGKRVTDSTSGFRACGSHAIDCFCESYPTDYPEPESIVFAIKKGLKIKEVPVVMHERQSGSSSIRGLSSVYYMIKVSIAIMLVAPSRKDNA